MLDPFIKDQVDNEKFIVHVAGGNSEYQEFVVEDKGSTLLAKRVAVYFELLVLETYLESKLLVVERKIVD